MNMQILSEMLAAKDSDAMQKKIINDIFSQGLSTEATHFILSHDKNTTSCQILSAFAYIYLNKYQQAIQLLDELVLVNNTNAMIVRAGMYMHGYGTANHQPDYPQAILLLDKAIEHGDTLALVVRAAIYRNGRGTANHQPDYAQAILLLDRAIERGNTQALVARAEMYRDGQGTANHQPNYAQAILLLDKAIEHGDTRALVVRAYMYRSGHGTANHQADCAQAILLLDRAIEHGNTNAMTVRAAMYRDSQGTVNHQPDYPQAILLLDRAIEHGDTLALVVRAELYRDGRGTANHQPDYAQAILLLDKAIERCDTLALVVRAAIYRNGRGTANHQPNYAQAILLLDRAIEHGNNNAMTIRAGMYRDGQGTANHQPDYAQAILLLDRAIEHGNTNTNTNTDTNINAMIIRADMYIKGHGTVCDKFAYSRTMELITKALSIDRSSYTKTSTKHLLTALVENNHLDAEYFLFINLYKQNGYFQHDKAAALKLFQKHPLEHFATFCQACIEDIKKRTLTEEAHQVQVEHINELLSLIPKNKETPVVQAAINRFMAYAALLIAENVTVSYEYFRAVPEDYLSADDYFEISHQVFLNETNSNHQDRNTNMALDLAQYAQEKSPNDEKIIGLNTMLSKLYLKKNIFTQNEKISPYENLQLHARTPTLNKKIITQRSLLKEYQSYLLLKNKFEPQRRSVGLLNLWTPVDNSKHIQDTVSMLIHQLDHGNTLESLLNTSDIKHARDIDASFNGVINKLMELSFLPEQDFKEGASYCGI